MVLVRIRSRGYDKPFVSTSDACQPGHKCHSHLAKCRDHDLNRAVITRVALSLMLLARRPRPIALVKGSRLPSHSKEHCRICH